MARRLRFRRRWMREAMQAIRGTSPGAETPQHQSDAWLNWLGLAKYCLATGTAVMVVAVAGLCRRWGLKPLRLVAFYIVDHRWSFCSRSRWTGTTACFANRVTGPAAWWNILSTTRGHAACGGDAARRLHWPRLCPIVVRGVPRNCIWYEDLLRLPESPRAAARHRWVDWSWGHHLHCTFATKREHWIAFAISDSLASDLHLGHRWTRNMPKQLVKAAQNGADIILLGGDLLDHATAHQELQNCVTQLASNAQVYAVA